MASYESGQLKSGVKVLLDGEPCSVVDSELVKPGKGQAFNRVKLRNLKSGRLWERTFKSGESLEAADVFEADMQYLYTDGNEYCFMKTDGTYEQVAIDAALVGDLVNWLKEELEYRVVFWNNQVIMLEAPKFVELQVVATESGSRGDTIVGGTKSATLSTGTVVKVPLFVESGDILKINISSGEYVSRV